MAVNKYRQDIVTYLLGQGVKHLTVPARENLSLTPYHYAREICKMTQWSDRDGDGQYERAVDIAIQLSSTSPNTAFTPNLLLGPEMQDACEYGTDRLALHLLERFRNSDQGGIVHPTLSLAQNTLLRQCITCYYPMPTTIRRLFELGAHCRDFYRNGHIPFTDRNGHIIFPNGNDGIPFSHANIAWMEWIEDWENVTTVLKWEIETKGAQTPPEEVFQSIATVANIARDDENWESMRQWFDAFSETGHIEAQRLLLWYSIEGGQKSCIARLWLVQRVSAVDAMALRYAICYRDWCTLAFLLRAMAKSGESIDERLERVRDDDPGQDIWYDTPLTIALAHENYQAAANLLASGADPSKIPANIRHRVRKIQHRVEIGHITDIVDFVFGNGIVEEWAPLGDKASPTEANATATLEFVFERLLRDPAHPLPPYTRPRNRPDLPEEHSENDSDYEDLREGVKRKMIPKLLSSGGCRGPRPYQSK